MYVAGFLISICNSSVPKKLTDMFFSVDLFLPGLVYLSLQPCGQESLEHPGGLSTVTKNCKELVRELNGTNFGGIFWILISWNHWRNVDEVDEQV